MQNDDNDARLRTRLAELMSSGGLGYNQISQEVLYLLPSEFIRSYTELWEQALGSAGGGDARGQQLARDAHLGKAQTKTVHKGSKIGAGAGGAGKKWKKMGFEIKSEAALNYKARVDRRLRALGREMAAYVSMGESSLGGKREAGRCGKCGKIMEEAWVHCPFDGSRIGPKAS